jgi:osmotically-inducible protein OsmY
MPFDHSERGHKLEHYPRRGEPDHDIRRRSQTDREFYAQREDDDDDRRYMGSGESRQWRGHDYDSDDEFDREQGYAPSDRGRQGPLQAEHRERFLRRAEGNSFSRSNAGRYDQWRREGVPEDVRWSGPYAGRGPKGYHRSDERIHEDVCERLTEHPAIDASDIEIAVSEGDVTLSGQVESRAVKHLTEAMVETVSGVKEVHNHLRVGHSDEGAWARRSSEERRENRPEQTIAPETRRR